MQLTSKDICDSFDDPEMMSSINDILFSEIKGQMINVPNLIMDVPPLGKFYYRKKKCEKFLAIPGVLPDTECLCNKIVSLYENFDKEKLEVKYENFGKENHEAFLLAKKQGKIQKFEKDQSEQHP